MRLVKRVREFLVNESGATATEYAVMLSLIIVVALIAISALGNTVSQIFTDVESDINPGS